jgi:hypothetical protein
MAAPKGNKNAVGNEGGRPQIWTEKVLDELAKDILKWADLPDSIVIKCWAVDHGIHQDMLPDLKKKSIKFCLAHNIAKDKVGCRREKLALLGELDAGIVKCSMATYDREHLEMLKELKRTEGEAKGKGFAQAINVTTYAGASGSRDTPPLPS